MTDNNQADHPCLPGGLIPLEQWRVPETSVRRTIRSGLRDILDQLKAGIHPDEQAFRSLDDLPTLSERQIQDYAPVPDREELARALLNELDQLRRSGGQSRKACVLVAPPFSGIAEALHASGRRVIAPPDNLLMPEKDIAGWWDHQLQDDDWVIPELADFWLRHRSGLGLLREFFARLALDKVGKGIIGCSSWCWQFWTQYLPELHLAPLTPGPLSGDRLTDWLGHLAGERPQGPLTARMTQDGLYVLPAPSGDDDRKYSLFTRDLATLARGNPGVALAIWRRTLRARPEDEAQQQEDGDRPQDGRQCWVAPLDQLSLPAVPQSSARQSGHLLHALLLHNGLNLGQLELTSGLPGQELRVALYEMPYRPGDWIEVNGRYGEVRSIGTRAAEIVTLDDTVIVIPHSLLWNTLLANGNDGTDNLMCVAEVFLDPNHNVGRMLGLFRDAIFACPLTKTYQPVLVTVSAREAGMCYRLKAYPLEPREQARFISDLTARAAEICGDEGVRMVSYPYLEAQKS